MRAVVIAVALFALFMLTACGGGKYKHDAGICSIKNGSYQVLVYVYRAKGKPDAPAARILDAACKAAYAQLGSGAVKS